MGKTLGAPRPWPSGLAFGQLRLKSSCSLPIERRILLISFCNVGGDHIEEKIKIARGADDEDVAKALKAAEKIEVQS